MLKVLATRHAGNSPTSKDAILGWSNIDDGQEARDTYDEVQDLPFVGHRGQLGLFILDLEAAASYMYENCTYTKMQLKNWFYHGFVEEVLDD